MENYAPQFTKYELEKKENESEQPMLFFSRAQVAHFARDLRKGDAVTITGTLGYKPIKGENGNPKRQVSIIVNYLEKVEYNRQEELTFDEVSEAIVQAA